MTQLKKLALHHNRINSPIPKSWSTLTNLE